MKKEKNELLRSIPPVHELQKDDEFISIQENYHATSEFVTKQIQLILKELRTNLLDNKEKDIPADTKFIQPYIWERVEEKVSAYQKDRLTRLINGTGTVLHTNLGRARLSEEAIHHAALVAGNYSNLEFQVEEGKRGSRHNIIEDLIIELTGAEAAMVVNNNAAAVYLILRALANEQEVIVSRGELIEIGGSFRVSSIMEESGAKLVEVGTTNKTHLHDYEEAITESTAMLLKVHTSNFKTIGFTESVERNNLCKLKENKEGLIVYEDLGSGSLYDFQSKGIGDEPVVRKVMEEGVDVVSFSGDKLLGGPQAGIIAGKKEYISKLKKHQLARVLRVDKMTFAALEKTLRAYLGTDKDIAKLPTVRDIIKNSEEIRRMAEQFQNKLEKYKSTYMIEIKEDTSQIGGGTMPDVFLPTFVAEIKHNQYTAEQFARSLRKLSIPIISRIKGDAVLIDFRTITESEFPLLVKGFDELQGK